MTRLGKDLIVGPIGYDDTANPATLDPKFCQNLVNLLPDRQGLLRGNTQLTSLGLSGLSATIDGVGWFYNQSAYYTSSGSQVAATTPHLIVVSNGALSLYTMTNSGGLATTYPPAFTGPSSTQGTFIKGQRVRLLGFGEEVLAVQNANNFQNYRVEANGSVYQMGIPTPTLISGIGGVVVNSVPTTPSQAITSCTGSGLPIVLTVPNHGFQPGQRVWVAGVGGNTNANGFAYVGETTQNTFGLFTNGITPQYQFIVDGGTILATTGVPATWTLSQIGAFSDYTFTNGDKVTITSGTNVTTGTYQIIAKISDDAVVLSTSPLTGSSPGYNIIALPVGNYKTGNAAYTSGGTVVPYNKDGVVQYSMTFVDAFGRESDLSTPVSVDYVGGLIDGVPVSNPLIADASITATGLNNAGASGAVVSANIYATAGNGTVFYLIANLPYTGTGDPTYQDNLTDLQVQTGTVAAYFGENAPPLPASLIGTDNGRIFLNATTAQGVIQISNQNSPTQFAVTPSLQTDGETIALTSDQGNTLAGFATFGSMFAILLRRGMYVIQGTDYTTWYVTKIHDRGCIAPDSVLRCDNHVCWLSDDGVYVGSYIYRFQLEKFSKPIEADLQAYNATTTGRQAMENSVAAFVNNTYMLAIGNIIYCYDFDTQGWYKLALSGAATITCMNVVQQPGTPGLLYIGLSNNTVCILDRYTPNQTVSGMVYRTRLVQPDPSADEAAKGQTVDTLRTRTKRVCVYGEGTITSGSTITMTCDGRTETYPIPTTAGYPPIPWNVLGTLIFQEFTPAAYGKRRDVTLNLNGTGIIVQAVIAEGEVIG
jgi:hypothetical protein